MKALITQSNYIPWKGYFDAIARADVCVLYDDVQYTRRDWRNRNKIKTADGLKWLTVPVKVKHRYHQTIRETEVLDPKWATTHWHTIRHAYRTAPCFDEVEPFLSGLYERGARLTMLSSINRLFLGEIAGWLGIDTPLRCSGEFDLVPGRTERLVALCTDLGVTSYLSGPAARDYLDVQLFEEAGIQVEWMDYSDYPAYRQLHGPFEHGLSIVDALVHLGPDAARCFARDERPQPTARSVGRSRS